MDTTKSMLDVAFEAMVANKKEMSFSDLYNAVATTLTMTEDEKKNHLGQFYTDLTLDGRFVAMTDNVWDLRSRHTYDKVHIDINDVYSDVEESDEDAEDEQEEKAYDAEVEGKPLPEAESHASEETNNDDEKTSDVDVASLVSK